MTLNRSKLPEAVRSVIALGAATAMGMSGTALAQSTTAAAQPQGSQNQTKTLQTIEVTGSHIRRAQLASSNPVITVTAQQIEATGKLTLGSVIQQLPAVTGGIHTPNLDFGGNTGGTFVGLRGLGASRTLVLIDGQRVLGESRANGAVDLNSIPAAAVERIEVLTDGASAIYGTDAIGGVINVILKSHYQGAQFSANYGISDHDDGERKGASFVFGQTTDKGSLLAGVSYNKFDPVEGSARKFSRDMLSLTTTAGGARKAILGAGGDGGPAPYVSITVTPGLAAKFGCSTGQTLALNESAWAAGTSPTTPADYHCYGNSDNYNMNAVLDLVTPQERTNAFFKGEYNLSDNVSAFMTVMHDKTDSSANVYPDIFGTLFSPGVAISKDNYYNPFGVDFSESGGNQFLARLYPYGVQHDIDHVVVDYLMTGLRGDTQFIGHHWTWDVGMDYSHISQGGIGTGQGNNIQLAEAAGPSFKNSDGVVQCGTPSAPVPLSQCVPWDPFNLNSASAESELTSPSTFLGNSYFIERNYHADASGGLFDLPAGTAELAVGVSYRKDYQNGTTDPAILLNPSTGTCTIGSSCAGAALQAGFDVKEAYGELFVPILHDLPFIHALNITLGDRYSKYSDFGSTSNWKIGLDYRPTQDLLLRGTISTVFRAPTLANVYGSPSAAEELLVSDPCEFTAPTPSTPNPNAGSPACVGVPATGSFVNHAVHSSFGIFSEFSGAKFANFPIQPETGKSFDFGAVYSPPFAPGLTVSVDFWRIYLDNLLTRVGAQTELNLCAFGDTVFCPLITRLTSGASAGQIEHVVDPTINLGRLDDKGVDFSGHYRLPFDRYGQFTLGLHATYQTQFKAQTAPGAPGNVVSNGAGLMGVPGTAIDAACPGAFGGTCYFPRIRGRGTLNWQLGPWSAQWTMQYLGRFHIAGDASTQEGLDNYGATVYNDLTAGYDIQPINTRVAVGVDNVFDKQPPLLFMNRVFELNTDTEDFDVLGRYYWARMTVSF